jgi:hypothetical protein
MTASITPGLSPASPPQRSYDFDGTTPRPEHGVYRFELLSSGFVDQGITLVLDDGTQLRFTKAGVRVLHPDGRGLGTPPQLPDTTNAAGSAFFDGISLPASLKTLSMAFAVSSRAPPSESGALRMLWTPLPLHTPPSPPAPPSPSPYDGSAWPSPLPPSPPSPSPYDGSAWPSPLPPSPSSPPGFSCADPDQV